ncbi:transporter substrate-binding domain-containing protein [Streptomyces sp. NBC_01613]|uniref:ABC transporter substrate-binding protein n=1 Tax=Streptomyces sp. NBC_01613 TaxID=2975896 RepID=UPI00386CBC29
MPNAPLSSRSVRRSRRSFTAIALSLSGLVLAGCGSGTTGKASDDNPYGLIQAGTITSATQTSQPPFAYGDDSGKPVGFIVDVTDQAAKRLKLKVDYKSTSVTGALAGLTAGQFDLASSGLGVTAEREKSVSFTKPLFWSTVTVLTTKTGTSGKISDFDGFTGKKVGVVTGSSQEAQLPTLIPKGDPVRFQTQNTAVSQLLNGSIDAFLVGGPDAKEFMKQYKGLRVAVSAPVDHPTSMAVPKGHTALLKALDEQIAAMVEDGTYAKLYRKYFDTEPEPELIKAWPALAAQFPGAK